jgi:hypothetical protein
MLLRVHLYLEEETELYHGHEPAYRLRGGAGRPALAGSVSYDCLGLFNRSLSDALVGEVI